MNKICNGVWPTMITLFNDDNTIDYNGMEKLIEWYLESRVNGLFAICQSSEMFFLSLDEKIELIKFIIKQVNGRVPVIASGHTTFDMDKQIYELNKIAETGIDSLVLISNILAGENKNNFKENVNTLLNNLPKDIDLGIYECPYPFKYLMTPELLKWCGETGRFKFLKDTCCDLEQIKLRLDSIKGMDIKIFNANSATLLDSLRMGASGFSGVMANMYPRLYTWLCENYEKDAKNAEELQAFLGFASMSEYLNYPLDAKYWLRNKFGTSMHTRSRDVLEFQSAMALQIDQMDMVAVPYLKKFC